MNKKKIGIIAFINIFIFLGCFVITNTKVVGIVNNDNQYHFFVKNKNYEIHQQVVISRDNKYILGIIIADSYTSSSEIKSLENEENKKELNYLINKNGVSKNTYIIKYESGNKKHYIEVSKSEIDGKTIN